MHEAVLRWLRHFGRLDSEPEVTGHDLEALDGRLTQVEQDLSDQEARVRLLEYQANPRGQFADGC